MSDYSCCLIWFIDLNTCYKRKITSKGEKNQWTFIVQIICPSLYFTLYFCLFRTFLHLETSHKYVHPQSNHYRLKYHYHHDNVVHVFDHFRTNETHCSRRKHRASTRSSVPIASLRYNFLTIRRLIFFLSPIEARMFISLLFEEFLGLVRRVFLYLVSHVPRVSPRAAYLFFPAYSRSLRSTVNTDEGLIPPVKRFSCPYVVLFSPFCCFVTRSRRNQHFTKLIHIDECVIVPWFLISGEQRWPTIGEARGVFPLASARDSSSDRPRADQHDSESPCACVPALSNVLTALPPATPYPFHPFLISSCFSSVSCQRSSCFYPVPRLSLALDLYRRDYYAAMWRLIISFAPMDSWKRINVCYFVYAYISIFRKDFWFKDIFPF